MRKEILQVTLPICGAILIGGAWLANAGSLTPPSGAVSATGRFGPRTEIDQLPFTINTAGSYYLGKNLDGGGSTAGITINTGSVTIDLNGFSLSSTSGAGIVVPGGGTNITIKNGVIRNCGGHGISAASADNCILANLQVCDNLIGIRIGSHSSISKCTVKNSSVGTGIEVNGGTVITECASFNNGGNGIETGGQCVVTSCTATQNGHGYVVQAGTVVSNCTASTNTGNGFNTSNALVIGCSAVTNTGGNYSLVAGSLGLDNHSG